MKKEMREKIEQRGKNRTTQKWDDVRVSGSGTLYIERSDMLRRRVHAILQRKRKENTQTAD